MATNDCFLDRNWGISLAGLFLLMVFALFLYYICLSFSWIMRTPLNAISIIGLNPRGKRVMLLFMKKRTAGGLNPQETKEFDRIASSISISDWRIKLAL